MLTTCVAVVSVSTVILPSEALIHQWQHKKKDYSIYSNIAQDILKKCPVTCLFDAAALVIGNYGLWNAYAIVTALFHAPPTGGDCVCVSVREG